MYKQQCSSRFSLRTNFGFVFIDDINVNIKSDILKFAVDIKIFRIALNEEEIRVLQEDLR